MLDSNFTLFSFKTDTNINESKKPRSLLIKGCNVYGINNDRIYSDFEDISTDILNDNDYGFGLLEIHFVLENNVTQHQYPYFYTKCFVVRTDNDVIIKPMKSSSQRCFSKLDSNGNLIISIGYFFVSEKEMLSVKNCSEIIVEGFVALDKPRNVFGIMAHIKNHKNQWKLQNAFTYKPKYAGNIHNLID